MSNLLVKYPSNACVLLQGGHQARKTSPISSKTHEVLKRNGMWISPWIGVWKSPFIVIAVISIFFPNNAFVWQSIRETDPIEIWVWICSLSSSSKWATVNSSVSYIVLWNWACKSIKMAVCLVIVFTDFICTRLFINEI